jgi:hypothetical protein
MEAASMVRQHQRSHGGKEFGIVDEGGEREGGFIWSVFEARLSQQLEANTRVGQTASGFQSVRI